MRPIIWALPISYFALRVATRQVFLITAFKTQARELIGSESLRHESSAIKTVAPSTGENYQDCPQFRCNTRNFSVNVVSAFRERNCVSLKRDGGDGLRFVFTAFQCSPSI